MADFILTDRLTGKTTVVRDHDSGAGPKAGGGYPAPTGQSPHAQEGQVREFDWDYEIPPQPIDLAHSEYVSGLEMPGQGGSGPSCGSVKAKIACPSVAEPIGGRPQLPGAKPHTVALSPHFCKSPRCRTCWPMWLQRAAMRGEERIEAARVLYAHKEPRHFTFSPPQKETCIKLRTEGVDCLANLYRTAYSKIRRAGIRGGLVVFHPWRCSGSGKDRYRTSHRRLAPHFHVVGFGYTTRSSEFYEKTGWMLKNHNAAREKRHRSHGRRGGPLPVFALLKYLLDHCGLNVKEKRTKDALRAFGTVHQLKVVDTIHVEEAVSCASCQSQCWVYEPDPGDEDGFGPPIEAAITVRVCRVFARHAKAKKPPGAPDLYYSISACEPDHAPPPGMQTGQSAIGEARSSVAPPRETRIPGRWILDEFHADALDACRNCGHDAPLVPEHRIEIRFGELHRIPIPGGDKVQCAACGIDRARSADLVHRADDPLPQQETKP